MAEREMFLSRWTAEHATTLKILKQLPEGKADFKPAAEKTRSAKELAAIFILEFGLAEAAVNGQVDFGKMSSFKTPATYAEVLEGYKNGHAAITEQIKGMSEADWNGTMAFPTGPQQMGQIRRGDVLWMTLMDSIHHRGQFSVYLRLVGAKVPSIYGPSGDEPWM